MARIALVIATLGLTLLLGIATEARAQGAQACSTATEPQAITSIDAPFYPVKPLGNGTFRRRDLEFQWDAQYDLPGTLKLSETDQLTLEQLGMTFADRRGLNPFGADLSDIRLVYEYFRADTTPAYNNNPFAPSGIVVGRPESYPICNPGCGGLLATPPLDRGHLDHYLYFPGHDPTNHATWPSRFYTAKEDSSTGPEGQGSWWVSDAQWTVWPINTIQTHGPANASPAARTDLDGTGWARPGGGANVAFCHEFTHSLPNGGPNSSALDEIFGLGAEAVAGNLLSPSNFDVSYVYGLVSTSQQQHKWMFASYLAYNFRGIDTSPTLTGFQDDLFYRWAKGDRHLYALAPLLSDAICAECSPTLKPYFHPPGVSLSGHDRLQLLIHNWRVANFVNNSSLAAGQYGYPPQFGFTPKDNAGAWQNRNGNSGDDVHVTPPEIIARPTMAVRETTMVGTRYSAAGSFPMSLQPFGSEYWIVRADPALGTTVRDLVVRVSPEGIYRCVVQPGGDPPPPTFITDVRLMASVVGYSVPADSLSSGQLWAHPEWAVQALTPIWVDADSVAGGLELVLPGFGTTVNAAVVVISLGDGPGGGWSRLRGQAGSEGILPYRLSLALRTAPYQDPNPVAFMADPLLIDESPTWSPAGDEIAYVCRDAVSGLSGICFKPVDVGSPLLLTPATTEVRAEPDWSPRGDWIAFSREAPGGSGDGHIWVVNRWTQVQRQITSGQGLSDASPAFEPHGQRIAYIRSYPGQMNEPQVLNMRQLRRINLDGTGDILLADLTPMGGEGSLRWSPDGRFVYFARNGSLYAVPADGGTPIARPALLSGAKSFDFHRGQGRLLAEQAGVMIPSGCTGPQPTFPFVRLALRDTLANDTQTRFYRTGAQFFQPRWSPEGTRIAYSSNQNTANNPTSANRDVFIGQVSYNHAPTIPFLPDVTIPAGPTFEMEVWMAPDPDGEAITDDAPSRYLPPGATFNPGTHRFTWPNPGPPMSEHFVVFRRMDGSGGVATKVVRIAVSAAAIADLNLDVVGSDLVWLTWTAPGASGGPSAVEYDLRYAQFAITEANFGYSSRAWDVPPSAAPGTIQTHKIGGLSSCTPYWFAIKSKDVGGNWSPISNVPSTTTMCGGGGGEMSAREVGPTVAGAEPGRAEPAFARPGERDSTHVALVVEMAGTALAPRWSVHYLPAEEQAALEGDGFSGIVLQGPDAESGWSERARLALPGAGWRFGLRALRRPTRLIFFGAYDLQQTWNVVAPGGANTANAMTLAAAGHSRDGDLTASLGASDGYSAGLGKGDTLTLRYAPTTAAYDSAPPWFMVVGPAGSTGDLQGFRGRGVGDGEAKPTAFALRQNRPNPFSGTTEIRFELPAETPVRLEVFDAQGRVVRTLAGGAFPAGFHSVTWDQRDASGARVRPGIYFYRMVAGSFRAQRKMVLL